MLSEVSSLMSRELSEEPQELQQQIMNIIRTHSIPVSAHHY